MDGPRVRLRELVVCAAAFMLGAIAAFASAGPALFADGDFAERLVVLAVSVAVYGVLGFVVGLLAPGLWKAAAACLVIPLVPVVVLFGGEMFASSPMAFLAAGFLLGDTAAALFGAWVGVRVLARRTIRRAAA